MKRGSALAQGSRKLKILTKEKKSLLILREEFIPGRGNNSRCVGLEAACLYVINYWFSVIRVKGNCAHLRGRGRHVTEAEAQALSLR